MGINLDSALGNVSLGRKGIQFWVNDSGGLPSLVAPYPLISVALSTTEIYSSWTDMGVDSFSLERATQSDFSDAVEVYSGTNRDFSDTGLTIGTTYYYRVKAILEGYSDSEWVNSSAETVSFMPEFHFDGRGIDLFTNNSYADTSLTPGQATIDILKSTINIGPTATPVSTIGSVLNGNNTGATGGNTDFAFPVISLTASPYNLSTPVAIEINTPFTLMVKIAFIGTPVNHRLAIDLTNVNKRIQFSSLSAIGIGPNGTIKTITLTNPMVLRKLHYVAIQRRAGNSLHARVDDVWYTVGTTDGSAFEIGQLFGSLSVQIERIQLAKQELTDAQIDQFFTQGEIGVYTPAATVDSSDLITITGSTYNNYTGPYISDPDLGNNATNSTNRGMKMLSIGDKICFLAQKEYTLFNGAENFYNYCTTISKLSDPILIPGIGITTPDNHDANSFIDYDRKFLFMQQNAHYTRVPNSTIIRKSAPDFDLSKISDLVPIGGIPNTTFSMSQYHSMTVMADGKIQVSCQAWDGNTGGYLNHFSIENERIFNKVLLANTEDTTTWFYPMVLYNNVVGDWHYLLIKHFTAIGIKGNYLYLVKTQDGKTFYNQAETYSKNVSNFNYFTPAELQANCLIFDTSADLGSCVCNSAHVDVNGVIHGVAGRGDGGYRLFRVLADGTIESQDLDFGATSVIQNDTGIAVAFYGYFLHPKGGDEYDIYMLYDPGDGLWQPTKFSTIDFGVNLTEDRNFTSGIDPLFKHTRLMGPQNICFNNKMGIMATVVDGSDYEKLMFVPL